MKDGSELSDAVVAEVLRRALSAPARLGSSRLLCIDGTAGSGKSTLARAVVAAHAGSSLVQTDEMLHGWGGLPGLGPDVERMLAPLREDLASSWHRWDWQVSDWAGLQPLDPAPLIVLEGVGCWSPAIQGAVSLLVFVDADPAERRRRWLDREGDLEHFDSWALSEAEHHASTRVADHADLRLRT